MVLGPGIMFVLSCLCCIHVAIVQAQRRMTETSPISTSQVILSTWLFTASSVMNAPWWHYYVIQGSSHLCLLIDPFIILSFPGLFVFSLPAVPFPGLLTNQPSHLLLPMTLYIFLCQPAYFSIQSKLPDSPPEVQLWEEFFPNYCLSKPSLCGTV